MPVVWMYQHPSHKDTWKQFDSDVAARLEAGYQSYRQDGTPEIMEMNVAPNVVVAIHFGHPMRQHSPVNNITRRLRRFVE